MGFDSSVYLIYGVRFGRESHKAILGNVFKVIVPDLLDSNGDLLRSLDDEPHANGYYCLDIGTDITDIFVACWFHEHDLSPGNEACLEIDMPSEEKKIEFHQWCVNNGIDQEVKFYIKHCDSY